MDASYTKLYTGLLKVMKSLEGELIAYRAVYEAVEASGRFPDLVWSLQAAKNVAQSEMNQKYDQAIEKLSTLRNEQELLEVLAKLDPKGPIN